MYTNVTRTCTERIGKVKKCDEKRKNRFRKAALSTGEEPFVVIIVLSTVEESSVSITVFGTKI